MKRLLDLGLALPALVVLTPVILGLALLIRLQSAGPGILRQTRVGRHQSPFTCYKLRTMYADTAHVPSHQVGSSAITPIGAVLRRFKLDELPQLYNVVRGDMSLIGPRPCLPGQHELIAARSAAGVFAVRPGISGLAQVQGVDMSDPARLAEVDGHYVRTCTILGDIRLIWQTVTGSGVGRDAADLAGR